MSGFAKGKAKIELAGTVAAYYRVSTVRQLKSEVSIPSQRKEMERYCSQLGLRIVAEFIDGVSGTDDQRPQFQRMLDAALGAQPTFDHILVYSYSRFYRSGPESEILMRRLSKTGIRVVSVTQPIGDDPAQLLTRQVIGILDEHTSRENSKNVRRAMRENATQGFWNGTTPPLGYRSVTVETRGAKLKKRLEIDLVEAELVRLAYDLYRNGTPGRWPLGVKEVVKILNEGGHRTRSGAMFGVGPMYHILTARYYATGLYPYGATNTETGEANAPETVVFIPIPVIIIAEVFDAVQAMLALKNPRVTPPRAGNGPPLLIGLATCALRGAGMTRTGTTRGERRYTYYTCAGRHQKGEAACPGLHIPTAKLDDAVVSALKDRLLKPERLARLIRPVIGEQMLVEPFATEWCAGKRRRGR